MLLSAKTLVGNERREQSFGMIWPIRMRIRLLRTSLVTQRRARAKELMIHREFEALMEESLIDQVFISPTLWKGSVTLPTTPASGVQKRYRLAVAEYEEYLVDDDVDDRGGDAYDPLLMSKDRRLVFIEYVEL